MITLSYRTSTCHWICLLYFIFNPHLSFSHWESNILSFTEEKKGKKPSSTNAKGPSVTIPGSVQYGNHKKKGPKKNKPWKTQNFPQNLNQNGDSQKQSPGEASFKTWRTNRQLVLDVWATNNPWLEKEASSSFFNIILIWAMPLGLWLYWGGLHILNYLL